MKKLIYIVALLAPAALLAEDGDRGRSDGKGGRLLCRTMAETGSRLAKTRLCKTRDEWAEYKRTQREELERSQRKASWPKGE